MIKGGGRERRRLWLNPSDKHNSGITCDQWPWRMASKAAAGSEPAQREKTKPRRCVCRNTTAKKKKKREKKPPKLNIVLHISPLYLIASQPLLPISPSTVGDTQLLHTHTHTQERVRKVRTRARVISTRDLTLRGL